MASGTSLHAERGAQLFAEGRIESALEEYVLAYEGDRRAEWLLQIGRCHRGLGHHEEAGYFFEGYLERAAPDASDRAQARAWLQEEQGLASARAIGTGERKRDWRKAWWLWTGVGVALAGTGLGIGFGVAAAHDTPLPAGGLGTIDARR